jgi:thiol-disulfide isomerase/thioredoxin
VRPTDRLPWILALALAASLAVPAAGRAADDDVTLVPLKFGAFQSRLAEAGSKQYKFTIVDAWSTTCGPCMENFPHLVEMHRKLGSKGLQVISLSLDDPSDAKAVAAARKFLVSKRATFLNVLLDEEFGVGFEKLDINSIPAVFVYGPDGKLFKKYSGDDPNHQFTYAQVEKDVAALIEGGK